MPRALPAVLLALALSGCGEQITPPPDVRTPEAPRGERTLTLVRAGASLTVPANWSDIPGREPLSGGVESRRATLAVWRYPRAEPLPDGREQLARVRDLLVERVRLRDPSFELAGEARVTRRGGAPAVELTGSQSIAGRRVRVRSSHVYFGGAEIVLDAYAPPEHFDRLDRTVFVPALRSLELAPAAVS